MNKRFKPTSHLRLCVGVSLLIFFGAVLPSIAAPWPPDEATRKKMVAAFSAVLTHAATIPEDTNFRSSIAGPANVATAKAEVQKELDKANPAPNNVAIPADVVIMFYPPEEKVPSGLKDPKASKESSAPKETKEAKPNKKAKKAPFWMVWRDSYDPSSKYHIFSMPEVDGKPHYYKDHLKCCYPEW